MSKKISVMIIDDNRIDLFIHHEFIKHNSLQERNSVHQQGPS